MAIPSTGTSSTSVTVMSAKIPIKDDDSIDNSINNSESFSAETVSFAHSDDHQIRESNPKYNLDCSNDDIKGYGLKNVSKPQFNFSSFQNEQFGVDANRNYSPTIPHISRTNLKSLSLQSDSHLKALLEHIKQRISVETDYYKQLENLAKIPLSNPPFSIAKAINSQIALKQPTESSNTVRNDDSNVISGTEPLAITSNVQLNVNKIVNESIEKNDNIKPVLMVKHDFHTHHLKQSHIDIDVANYQALIALKELTESYAWHHQQLVACFQDTEKIFDRVNSTHKNIIDGIKTDIDRRSRDYNEEVALVSKLRNSYHKKCKELESMESEDSKDLINSTIPGSNISATIAPVMQSKTQKLLKEIQNADYLYRKGVMKLEDSRSSLKASRIRAVMECERSDTELLKATQQALETFAIVEGKVSKVRIEAVQRLANCSNIIKYCDGSCLNNDMVKNDIINQCEKCYEAEVHQIWPDLDKIVYDNFVYGSSKNMAFGVPLTTLIRQDGNEKEIPLILEVCINAIEKRGLDKEGLYRISPRHSDLYILRHELEKDAKQVNLNDETYDIHCVAGVVKAYLRELPIPVFEFPMTKRVEYMHKKSNEQILELCNRIRELPISHRKVLKFILNHLALVDKYSTLNKMTLSNIAILFTPILFQAQSDLASIASDEKEISFLKSTANSPLKLNKAKIMKHNRKDSNSSNVIKSLRDPLTDTNLSKSKTMDISNTSSTEILYSGTPPSTGSLTLDLFKSNDILENLVTWRNHIFDFIDNANNADELNSTMYIRADDSNIRLITKKNVPKIKERLNNNIDTNEVHYIRKQSSPFPIGAKAMDSHIIFEKLSDTNKNSSPVRKNLNVNNESFSSPTSKKLSLRNIFPNKNLNENSISNDFPNEDENDISLNSSVLHPIKGIQKMIPNKEKKKN